MKQWAIKRPHGSLIRDTVTSDRLTSWDIAFNADKILLRIVDKPDTDNFYSAAKKAGYKCVRVEVTELENPNP
jgi:hypothetical protein